MAPGQLCSLRAFKAVRSRSLIWLSAGALILVASGCRRTRDVQSGQITLNVAGFSVLKEPLENEILPAFQKQWLNKTGQSVKFASNFGGSEMVTNQILSGQPTDIAILSIERDAERIREGKATRSDWRELPHEGILARSPFVILVRKGNPKKIRDFADMAKPGIKVIHPDPVSSGGAQWSIVAIYGSEMEKTKSYGHGNETKARDLLRGIWKNVIATPESARAARTQFETGFGDALITYELEALQISEKNGPYEMVAPPSTIFGDFPVVIIDRDMSPEKRALVEVFANYLWSEPSQKTFVKYHFRSVTDEKLNRSEPRFARIAMPFDIDDLGGWSRAYPEIIEGVWKKQIQPSK
jgi:sulfate/thiosulfate transport system substrate-binding protein